MIYLFVYQLKEVFISASSDLSYSLLLFFRTFRTFRVELWFFFFYMQSWLMVEPTSSLFPQRVFLRCVKSINCRAVYKRGSLVLLLSYPYKGKIQTKMLKQGSFNASQLVNVQFTSVRFIGCQFILSVVVPVSHAGTGPMSERTKCIHFCVGLVQNGSSSAIAMLKHSTLEKKVGINVDWSSLIENSLV